MQLCQCGKIFCPAHSMETKHDFSQNFLSDFNSLHFLFSQTPGKGAVIPHCVPGVLQQPLLQHPWGSLEEKRHMRETTSTGAFRKIDVLKLKATLDYVILINSSFPSWFQGRAVSQTGTQLSVSQAEHLKLSEGFEVFASSVQTVLPPGRVPRPSLFLLRSHSW